LIRAGVTPGTGLNRNVNATDDGVGPMRDDQGRLGMPAERLKTHTPRYGNRYSFDGQDRPDTLSPDYVAGNDPNGGTFRLENQAPMGRGFQRHGGQAPTQWREGSRHKHQISRRGGEGKFSSSSPYYERTTSARGGSNPEGT
ncbi:unnamed protein product, partial [Laminaria digitata]